MSEKKNTLRVGVWTANYDEQNGQAIVTKRTISALYDAELSYYVYPACGVRSIPKYLATSFKLLFSAFAGRLDVLYMVPSRSTGGFVRDMPALFASFAGIRVIAHVHGSDIIDLLCVRKTGAAARALYSRIDLIVPSTHLLKPLADMGILAVRVCENFYSGARSKQFSAKLKTDVTAGTVGTYKLYWNSNLMATKGFLDVISAVGELRNEGFDIELYIIGRPIADSEGSINDIVSILSTLEKEHWFRYFGPVLQEEANSILDFVDAVVLPSRYKSECQPLAVVAAMCCAKVVVVADTPALRATLGSYPGLFVNPHSSSDLRAKIRALVEERAHTKRLRNPGMVSAAADAMFRFSEERYIATIQDIVLGAGK